MVTEKQNNKKIVSGILWKFLERFFAQFVSFAVSIVLARLLLPEDYGTVALVLVFIELANVFVVNGLNTALIQNKDADELDFSTLFYCNLFFSVIIYIILFFSAEFIANFYHNRLLIPVIRILALKMPLAAINAIQHAFVSRKMMFKKFFFSTLTGTITSGIIGIIMAVTGFGIWALVAQYLVNSTVDIIMLFFMLDWRPKMIFSFDRAKKMINYGWKITVGAFIDELYNQVRTLIIGKKYSDASLAYYNKGIQFPKLFISNINSSISSVLFPGMSNLNDKKQQVKKLCQRFIRTVSYIISPLMIGLFVVAEPLIELLLTERWLPCVPFMRIACITYMLTPVNSANLQAIKAMGESGMFLKMEFTKKIIGIIILLISMNYGVYVLALSTILVQIICNIVNIYPTKKILDYGYGQQILDILPSIVLSVVMGMFISILYIFEIPTILLLFIQVITGILIYILLSIVFKIKEFYALTNLFKEYSCKILRRKN